MWYGNQETFEKRAEAIKLANETGTNYQLVRTLQQARHDKLEAIQEHIQRYEGCVDCRLGQCPFVKNKVFYRGYIPCDVLFVGDSPGRNEDSQALPAIGDDGNILDKIITQISVRLFGDKFDNRYRWCVTNATLCVPYDQGEIRSPLPDELKACSNKLSEFIQIVEPKLIVTLGNVAERALKNQDKGIRVVNIPQPAWMNRQKQECQLHVKKAVLSLVPLVKLSLSVE